MTDKFFLDTNIIVYAYDKTEPEKESLAQNLLEEGLRDENMVISAQVLGEFFNVVTRHIPEPYTATEAGEIVQTLSVIQIVEVALADVFRAIDIYKKYQISYWDSLILSTAEQAGCQIVYSEDFSHQQVYNNVTVHNPFI